MQSDNEPLLKTKVEELKSQLPEILYKTECQREKLSARSKASSVGVSSLPYIVSIDNNNAAEMALSKVTTS